MHWLRRRRPRMVNQLLRSETVPGSFQEQATLIHSTSNVRPQGRHVWRRLESASQASRPESTDTTARRNAKQFLAQTVLSLGRFEQTVQGFGEYRPPLQQQACAVIPDTLCTLPSKWADATSSASSSGTSTRLSWGAANARP